MKEVSFHTGFSLFQTLLLDCQFFWKKIHISLTFTCQKTMAINESTLYANRSCLILIYNNSMNAQQIHVKVVFFNTCLFVLSNMLIAILLLDENINKKQEEATQQQQQQPKWNKTIILMWEYDSQWEWAPIMNMSSNSFGLLSF